MSDHEVTERGFRVFARNDDVRVIESSIAFQGPHVRIFGGREADGHVQLTLEQASIAMQGLRVFLAEAEAGKLTEPAPEGSARPIAVALTGDDVDLICFALGVWATAAARRSEGQEPEEAIALLKRVQRGHDLVAKISNARQAARL